MTVGALTVFLAYLSKFFKPVQDLAKMSNTLAQTAVAMERVQAILDTHAMVPERPDAREPEALKGGITFDHVGFGYDPAVLVLNDVNFNIAPGQLVGVVGATGGGKSTVVGLIPRFYDPGCGTGADRWGRLARLEAPGAAQTDRFRAARHGAVSGHGARQHRLWAAGCHRRGDRHGCETSKRG